VIVESLAAVALLAISVICVRAGVAAGEGTAGGAVRLLATLLIPAIALAFLHEYYWFAALALSVGSAAAQLPTALKFSARAPRFSALLLPAALLLILVAFKAALSIASVPYDIDSNLYHLPMAIAYLQVHSAVPAQVMFHPGNSELLDSLGLGALGGVGGQTLTEGIIALTLFLSSYGVAEELEVGFKVCFLCACAVLAIPLVVDQLFTAQNDLLVATLLLATIALWRRSALLSATALGLLAGTKFTGVVEGAVLLPILWSRRAPGFSWRHIALAAAIASPWYIRNALETGNPFFLGSQTAGFSSTIADHFASMASFWVLTAIRNYGGILTLIGFLGAVLLMRSKRSDAPHLRMLAPMIAVLLALWFFIPNTAETVAGTLAQIHSGWTLRYAIGALALLNIAAVVWLAQYNYWLAFAATSLWLLVGDLRAYHSVARTDGAVTWFALPLLAAAALAAPVFVMKLRSAAVPALCATVAVAVVAVLGSGRITSIWNDHYQQSNIGPALGSAQVQSARRVVTIGLAALAFVGPHFERYVVIGEDGTPAAQWWRRVEREEPDAVVTHDLPQSRMHDKEIYLRERGVFRLVVQAAGTRVYVPRAQTKDRREPGA
jgi:hypothetical protein